MESNDLYRIAYLRKDPLDYIVKVHDYLGFKEFKELSNHMRKIFSKDPNLLIENGKSATLPLGIYAKSGKELVAHFEIKKGYSEGENQKWALLYIDEKDKDLLYEFAICEEFNPKFRRGTKKLDELAKLALQEDWGWQNRALCRYIQYTFHYLKLNEEKEKGKIVEKDGYAIFNTGLVSRGLWHDIYAIFQEINSKKDGAPKYKLIGFGTVGQRDGKILTENFPENIRPKKADYFTRETAADILIFDHTKELHPDFEHIIFDGLRRNRFPQSFLEKYGITKAEIDERDFSNPKIIKIIQQLKLSIEHAQKRVSQNYKIALPMYYPTKNIMSFLLPIVLGDDLDGKADLALVVALEEGSQVYAGKTIITLPMAYASSRLICKPSNEWLEINSDSEIFDNDDYE